MIFVENTFSPLTVVGVLPDTACIPTDMKCDAARLWSNDIVLFALVVPGLGPDAYRAYRDLLEWLSDQRYLIGRRRCAFAWVIEDSALRASTNAWFALVRNTGWRGCGEVFQALRLAVDWLSDTAASWVSSEPEMESSGSAQRIERPGLARRRAARQRDRDGDQFAG